MINPVFLFRKAASKECHDRAQQICDVIADNPNAPFDRFRDPLDEGTHLKDSYSVQDLPSGSARVVTSKDYWHFVEYGTGRGPEQPHVRPAIEAVRTVNT